MELSSSVVARDIARRRADSTLGGVGVVRRWLRPRLRPRRSVAARPRRGHGPRPPGALEDGAAARHPVGRGRRGVHPPQGGGLRARARCRPVASDPSPQGCRDPRRRGHHAPRRPAHPRRQRRHGGGGGGGLGAAVPNNRGWLPVANDFFSPTSRSSPRRRSAGVEGRARQDLSAARPHRRVMVSDISLGSGRIAATSADRARARSTAASPTSTPRPTTPTRAPSSVLGDAMKGHRDKIFLATKFCTPTATCRPTRRCPKIIEAVEASLSACRPTTSTCPHPLLRPRRPPARAEHPRGVRPPEGAGQGALPRRQHATRRTSRRSRTPRSTRGRFDVMMLAYHLRHVADASAHILERAQAARRRRRRDEDAEGREAHEPGRVPRRGRRRTRRPRSTGCCRTRTSRAS